MSGPGAFLVPSGAQETNVTLPPEALCHYITDDELERLGDMRKEPVMEIFLCSVGAFLGALVPALQQLSLFQTDPTKVTMWDLLTIMIAAAMLVVSIVTGALWHQRSKVHKDLVTTIRARPKIPVRLAQDNAG